MTRVVILAVALLVAPTLGAAATIQERLTSAVASGDVDTVRELLDLGADPNVKEIRKSGMTPLMWAAAANRPVIAELLLARGADVDAANDGGRSALMLAANNGSFEVVEVLLRNRPLVNLRDGDGRTALDLARAANRGRIVALLERFKDLQAPEKGSGPVVDLACARAFFRAVERGEVTPGDLKMAVLAQRGEAAETIRADPFYEASRQSTAGRLSRLLKEVPFPEPRENMRSNPPDLRPGDLLVNAVFSRQVAGVLLVKRFDRDALTVEVEKFLVSTGRTDSVPSFPLSADPPSSPIRYNGRIGMIAVRPISRELCP